MELTLKPVNTEVSYTASFEDPELVFKRLKTESQIGLRAKLAKAYGLGINAIGTEAGAIGDRFVSLTKLEQPSLFELRFGLESITATLRNALNVNQMADFYSKAAVLYEDCSMDRQHIAVRQQLQARGNADVDSFLGSLNPKIPHGLEEWLHGRGVEYLLRFPDHRLQVHVAVMSSLFVENGLFLSTENSFQPNRYSFSEAFDIALKYRAFVIDNLNLSIEREATDG
ncbi:MAG: hypothetical protein SWE60_14130 [Thermodesulfobacteriota bacterium]|nr:hypothetical protein [Thermodesulfobacteriota bacterium]